MSVAMGRRAGGGAQGRRKEMWRLGEIGKRGGRPAARDGHARGRTRCREIERHVRGRRGGQERSRFEGYFR
jgi:hypothetical protein